MGETKPFVSVLMSCYNAELWVGETILSVLEQTFTNYEFIIVDDGSVDGTRNIIEKFAAKDPRIVPLFKTNSGLPDSLNYGLNIAQGDWIARIDADDLCEPQRLDLQVNRVLKEPDLVLLGTNYREIDENGSIGRSESYPELHNSLVKNLRTMKRFFPHSSAFFKADAARRLGGYNKKIRKAEDWKLWLDLSECGKVACIQENLVRIRTHANQISFSDGGIRQLYDTIAAIICHNLKRAHYEDPSKSLSSGDWDKFMGWVETEVNRTNFFEILEFKGRLKRELSNARNILKFGSLGSLLKIRKLSSVLIIMIMGNRLPARLTKRWIKVQNQNLL